MFHPCSEAGYKRDEHYPTRFSIGAVEVRQLLLVPQRSRSEEMSDQPKEPDQRRQARDTPCLTLHEKIRLVALSLGLLALFTGFLFFLFSGAIFPLLAAVVVVFLGYRQIDSRLDAAERSGQDTALWSGNDQARRPS